MLYGVHGHEQRIASVCDSLSNASGPRSFLFYGDLYVGKATSARAIASYLEHGESVSMAPVFDCTTLSLAGNSSIGIDAVLQAKEFLVLSPLRSLWRTVIIDDADSLTPQAQNALLKIVEEPSTRAVFIFITHAPHALLPSLLSRLTKIYFPRMSLQELGEILVSERSMPIREALLLARRSFGAYGRAMRLLQSSAPKEQDSDFDFQLAESILDLYLGDARSNASKILSLLRVQNLAGSHNINPAIFRRLLGIK